jgi:hypothetical protein
MLNIIVNNYKFIGGGGENGLSKLTLKTGVEKIV